MDTFFSGHSGEFYSLAAACSWACASLVFTSASRALGAGNLNRIRILLAAVILALAVATVSGWDWLGNLSATDFIALSASGVIGLVIGDRFYFAALDRLGPKFSTQLFSHNPVWSALLAAYILSEAVGRLQFVGMVVAISGVLLATSGRTVGTVSPSERIKAMLYALIASVCQAVGFVIAKYALANHASALEGNLIRMSSAAGVIWALAAIQGKVVSTIRSLERPRARRLALLGSIFGPTLGVWLGLMGITHTAVGVASTLMALTPLLVIVILTVVHGERLSAQNTIGATIAFAGVALIFL